MHPRRNKVVVLPTHLSSLVIVALNLIFEHLQWVRDDYDNLIIICYLVIVEDPMLTSSSNGRSAIMIEKSGTAPEHRNRMGQLRTQLFLIVPSFSYQLAMK